MLRIDKDIRPGNPTIAIRFCLDMADRSKIAELGVKDIRVFLVVVYENGQEDRQLLPLKDILAYVAFRYPGKHRVLARLVWGDRMDDTEKFLLNRIKRREYECRVLDYGNERFEEHLHNFADFSPISSEIQGDEFEVEMPHEYFAKEPSPW